jgi:hypothetical protein
MHATASGVRPDELKVSDYVRRRLLDVSPAFQQDADYTFYLYETWFRKNLSAATHVFVGKHDAPDRRTAEKRAYAVSG